MRVPAGNTMPRSQVRASRERMSDCVPRSSRRPNMKPACTPRIRRPRVSSDAGANSKFSPSSEASNPVPQTPSLPEFPAMSHRPPIWPADVRLAYCDRQISWSRHVCPASVDTPTTQRSLPPATTMRSGVAATALSHWASGWAGVSTSVAPSRLSARRPPRPTAMKRVPSKAKPWVSEP